MKIRYILSLACLLIGAGGLAAYLTRPEEKPVTVADASPLKPIRKKASETPAVAESPKADDGWSTGRIKGFSFADSYVEPSKEEKDFAAKVAGNQQK